MALLIAYPATGTGTPCDGPVNLVGQNVAFSTIVSGNGNQGGLESVGGDAMAKIQASTTTDQYQAVSRGFFGFDTAAIGDSDTITRASFFERTYAKGNGLGNFGIGISAATPAANNALPASTFQTVGSTEFASRTYSEIPANGTVNEWVFNSSGRSYINKTGYTWIATRIKPDMDQSATGVTWASNAESYYLGNFADESGTINDPKLVVDYTPSAGGMSVDITGGNSTDSQSVTIGTLSNGALYVTTSMRATASINRGVTSVSYGGNALTKVADYDNTGGSDRLRVTIWRLLNPPSGANTLAITPSGTPQSKVYGWISFSGVDQTTPEDAIGTGATGSSTTPSASVTSVTNEAYAIGVGILDSGSATVGFDGTQVPIVNESQGSRRGYASYEHQATAGAITMSETASGSVTWASVAIAVRPASSGGGGPVTSGNFFRMF